MYVKTSQPKLSNKYNKKTQKKTNITMLCSWHETKSHICPNLNEMVDLGKDGDKKPFQQNVLKLHTLQSSKRKYIVTF
jgi:hypothetical protein